ncbi:MAG: DUF2867 domain-containing protein [Salaquimonas sp.]
MAEEIQVSLPNDALSQADWIDAYQVKLPIGSSFATARQAAEAIVAAFPKWTYFLLMIRQIVLAPFGLKGPKHIENMNVESVGFFPIIGETENKLIAGFDDKHLDFRLVIDLESSLASQTVTLSTVIRRHNWIGRTYLALILPFHRLIIKLSLSRAAASR